MPFTRQELIDHGWRSETDLNAAFDALKRFEAKGITDPKYQLKLLTRELPPADTRLSLQDNPAPLAEAIDPTSPEEEAMVGRIRRQMKDLLRVPVIERGALMPDACPVGKEDATISVGGVIAAREAIFPAAHSADICCSLHATVFHSDKEASHLLDTVMECTRFGPGGRQPHEWVAHPVVDEPVWDNPFLQGLQEYARIHLADQGDGNHFAFLGRLNLNDQLIGSLMETGHTDLGQALEKAAVESEEAKVLITHHGSRGLGAKLYQKGLNAAIKQTAARSKNIPDIASWLDMDSEEGQAYWEALQYVARWTKANHACIHDEFLRRLATPEIAQFGNEHNFVWKRGDVYLHGKGATPAWTDDHGRPLLGLIPLNMASPVLLVLGNDQSDYLSFCPHGAGRLLSRTALRRQYRQKDGRPDLQKIRRQIEDSTKDIEVRWYRGEADLSETPVAYKSAQQVESQINQFKLARVIAKIEPLGSLMAGHRPKDPFGQEEEPLTPKQKRQIEHRADRRKQRQKMQNWEEE